MSTEAPAKPEVSGRSLVAGKLAEASGNAFHASNPIDGRALETSFYSATLEDVDRAVSTATDAFAAFAATSAQQRARLLRSIADGIDPSSALISTQTSKPPCRCLVSR